MNNQQPMPPMMSNNRLIYQPPQQQPPKGGGSSPFTAIFMLALIGGLIYLALNFENVMNYIENRESETEETTTNTENSEKKNPTPSPTPTPTPTPTPIPTPEPTPQDEPGKEEGKKEDEKKEDPKEPEEKENEVITSILSILPFDQIFAENIEITEDGYSGPHDKESKFMISPVGTAIKIDEYFTFKPIRSKDLEQKYIKWSVSNGNIASIDGEGKVKGLKTGTVTVTASMDNGMKATAELTVVNAGLSLGGEATLKIDKTTNLSIDKEYIGKTKFTSSNPKIATVDANGKVTPHRTGNVTITASSGSLMSSFNITIVGTRIHFINTHDVGDAILLENNNKFALIDTGSTNWETSRKYFFEYLDSLGLKEEGFEFVILTNQHYEHNGGMVSLLQKGYPVKKIYMKSYNAKDDHLEQIADRYNKIVETAASYGTQIVYVDKDSKFKEEISKSGTVDLDDMRVYFFNTLQRLDNANKKTFDYYKSNYYSGSSENVNSIVNLIYVNKHNILLGSDLNDYDIFNGVMKNKVKMVWNRNEKIDIFKVNNHGSFDCTGNQKYTVNATYYLVSNGIDNEYSNGKGNGYYISNDKVVYNNTERDSCFNNLGVNMCDAYYINNSSSAIIFNLHNRDIEPIGAKKGQEISKRCK